jgi:translation initiation factor IF-2
MTEKTAKRRIYQVAKEINISHETLIQYLRKRGHDVSGHMTLVSDAMMHDVLEHFKKDKEVAEKHHRKIQTLKESKKKIEAKVEPKAETKVVEAEEVAGKTRAGKKARPEDAPVQEETESTTPAIEEISVEPVAASEVVEVMPEPGIVETEAVSPVPEPEPSEPPPAAAAPVTPPPKSTGVTISPRRTPKMGLTIKGRIDLDEVKKQVDQIERASSGTTDAEKEADAKKKKKKKKRVRTEAPAPKPEETDELVKKSKKKKKLKSHEVDQAEVTEAIKRTLAEMDDATAVAQRAALKKKRKEKRAAIEQRALEQREREKTTLRVTEFVTVNELATLMAVNVAEVIKKCIGLGIMVSINQRLDKDVILLLAAEFGFDVEFFSELEEEPILEIEDEDEDLAPRPPVVTIMGHVDHGKTSLLDYIRQTNVVAGEAGGITQHIGAYSVTLNERKRIAFLDTPGHEAFTAMRARGAQVTDIVILVVAADDNVMPQTVEAISHAHAANVPIIIAINKCDKPEANPDKIRQQLAERNVLVEEWGGKYQCVELSARSGKNVDLLLEKILLEADVLDLKANAHRLAKGVIIEARVDKGKGIVASILVQKGTLSVGDSFIAGVQSGRIRAMFDERGNRIDKVPPSTPVQILGFDGVPQAGDTFIAVDNERQAREISLRRQQLKREQDFRLIRSSSLTDISKKISEGQVKELRIIVKGDVDGSVGALSDSLMKILHEEVRINVIHRAVGAITESDILLAAASEAVIIGFHVRPNLNARRLAEQENVDIRLYSIIYDAINDVKKALEGLLAPAKTEEVTATIEVRDTFKVPKAGTIAGCYVQDGKITRGNKVRLVRDGIVIFEGGISSLRRFKDDVREVEAGFECGIGLDNYNDVKVSDIIEAFKVVETQRKLS